MVRLTGEGLIIKPSPYVIRPRSEPIEALSEYDLRKGLKLVPENTYLEHPYPGIERKAHGELRIMRSLTDPTHGRFFADIDASGYDKKATRNLFAVIAKLPYWLRQMLGGKYFEPVESIQRAVTHFEVNQHAAYKKDNEYYDQDWLWLDTSFGEVRMMFEDFEDDWAREHKQALWTHGYETLRHLLRRSPFYDPSLDSEEIPF